jgi:hypothetical protein
MIGMSMPWLRVNSISGANDFTDSCNPNLGGNASWPRSIDNTLSIAMTTFYDNDSSNSRYASAPTAEKATKNTHKQKTKRRKKRNREPPLRTLNST